MCPTGRTGMTCMSCCTCVCRTPTACCCSYRNINDSVNLSITLFQWVVISGHAKEKATRIRFIGDRRKETTTRDAS